MAESDIAGSPCAKCSTQRRWSRPDNHQIGTTLAFVGDPPYDFSRMALDKVQGLFANIEEVDAAPRPSVKAAVSEVEREAESVAERWRKVTSQDLPALNAQLSAAGLGPITIKSEQP